MDIFHPRKQLVEWEHHHIGADPDQLVHHQELGQVNLWLASKFSPLSIKIVSFEHESIRRNFETRPIEPGSGDFSDFFGVLGFLGFLPLFPFI